MRTGLLHDARFLAHDTGPRHPERPARLTSALARLEAEAWFAGLARVEAAPAAQDVIVVVDRLDPVERGAAACRAGQRQLDTPDVAISAQSHDIALLAAGAGLALADALMAGTIANGFALVRPPGHHAERSAALGFCLYNNVAILARYLQRRHGLEKIAIVDWDVHHGNGTQHSFEEDPSVLYCSLHQYPHYPGTGSVDETGIGRGKGATLNCPMPAGATDSAYERAFMEQLLPALNQFKPDAVLISAGFDAHRDDPLADVQLSTGCYGWMTERLMEVAQQHAQGRVLSLLEGGYDLRATADCVALHLAVLGGFPKPSDAAR